MFDKLKSYIACSKKEWLMRGITAIGFLAIGITATVLGCNTTPCVDAKITKAIELLDRSTVDYCSISQPTIEKFIAAFEKQLSEEQDAVKKEELKKVIQAYKDAYAQGKQLPAVTKELFSWAKNEPLAEEKK